VQRNDLHVRLLAHKTGWLRASISAHHSAGIAWTTTIGQSAPPSFDYIHQHEGAAGVRRMLGALALALATKRVAVVVDDAA
jgi:hypothetical protein